MKIGVIITAYDCEDYVKGCLAPWLQLRHAHNMILTANSGQWKEYAQMGFPQRNKETLRVLVDAELDFLVTTAGQNLLDEDSSRNLCLDYLLQHEVDLVWCVDGDELYSAEQILRVLAFIEQHDRCTYTIQFKNYTLAPPLYTKGFERVSIYKTGVCGGIERFRWDSTALYKNGQTNPDPIAVPKEVAYVEHYAWLSKDQRSYEKISYQNMRFFGPEGERCAFEVHGNTLAINEAFWRGRNIEVPGLSVQHEPFSYELEVTYGRESKSLYVDAVQREMQILMKVFNLSDKALYTEFSMDVVPGVRYYVAPPEWLLVSDGPLGLNIEVWENDKLLHNEDIWARVKL